MLEKYRNRFSKHNYKVLNELLDSIKEGDYIVTDCDNSYVMHDTEENLFFYQLVSLKYKMTPEEFREVLFKDLPDDERIVDEAKFAADLAATYFEELVADDEFEENPHYVEFIELMCYLYLELSYYDKKKTVGFRILYLFKNFTEEELREMVGEMYEYTRSISFQRLEFNFEGKYKLHSYIDVGVGKFEEVEALVQDIKSKGAKAYVCTASSRIVVDEFMNRCSKGLFDKVVGLELVERNGVLQAEGDEEKLLTMGKGKGEYLEILKGRYNRPAMLYIGDSDGDYYALTNEGLKYGLIINRNTSGKIETLKEMAKKKEFENTIYLLQKRDEEKGILVSE